MLLPAGRLLVLEADQTDDRIAHFLRVLLFACRIRRLAGACGDTGMDHRARGTIKAKQWIVVVRRHCDLLY